MAGVPPQFMKKKPGNAAEDRLDGGLDDAQEKTVPPRHKGKKGHLPPGLQNAIARRVGGK